MTKTITDGLLKVYNRDIIRFLEDQYILPETKQTIRLEQWQKDLIFKPLFYDLNPDGTRKYTVALLGMPKKNGKSSIAAGIGLWFMFAGETYGEVIIAANNLDQASLVIYDRIKRAFLLNPQLKSAANIYKDAIEMKSTGTVCRPIAHKYQTAAGLNPTLVLFDELWGFPSREFYDELTTSPARKNPLNLIVTYAGYDKKSLLYEVYNRGMKGTDPEMFFLWLNENMASWVTPKYLASQRRRLPANSYARFHENRWSSPSEGAVLTDVDVARMHEVPWTIQFAPAAYAPFNYVVAVDLGLTHDRTARVVGHFNPNDNRVYIDNIRYWEGTKKDRTWIQEVERDLIDCAHQFKTSTLVVDPWQMEYVMQRLKEVYTIRPFSFQTDMVFMSQILVTMVRNGSLVCYHEPVLEDELLNAISKQTGKGWKLDHVRGRRNDLVVTTGMMAMEAVRGGFGSASPPEDGEFTQRPATFAGVRQKEF